MKELSSILRHATAAVSAPYFRLAVDDGDPVYRERVYCYELYHQMRQRWPEGTPYYLNGEVDKAAHPILASLGAACVKPDLLVHRPGFMGGNHAVIEIKASHRTLNARKDLKNLSLFVNSVGYRRAIFLIYGHGIDARLLGRVQDAAASIPDLGRIEVWLHSDATQSAIRKLTLSSAARRVQAQRNR